MRKDRIGFLIIVLTLVSCSKSSGPKILISEWEKKIVPKTALVRKLAASGPLKIQCVKDVFSVEMLKEEVKELEQDYAEGEKIKGQWKNIDLSTLPIPQANFLKSFGDQLGDLTDPNRFQNSTCTDVPCLFNSLYGKDNHIAGYVHYLWYLRLGHLLAADNLVPLQLSDRPGIFDGKVVPFKDYLYSDDELFGLWRISHMLKEPFTSIAKLKEIQRVPRGFKYEKAEFKSACGLASGAGWITLTDECLNINDIYNGPLYRGVIHELAHHIDFEEGEKKGKSYRSHEADYLKFAGMTLVEYVNEKQQKVRQWKVDPNAGVVSIYAPTNPQENYAESLTYFRIRGDQTYKSLTPEHLNFISTQYYDNQSYRNADLIQGMFKNYNNETFQAVFQAFKDCKNQTQSPASQYFKKGDFPSSVSPVMLNCIGVRASEISQHLKATFAVKEPEGCSVLNNRLQKFDWDTTAKNHLKEKFKKYFETGPNGKDYSSNVEAFYGELNNKTIARTAYVNCYGLEEEKSCFDSELKKVALQKSEQIGLTVDDSIQMAPLFTSLYNYQETKSESLQLYQTFIKSQMELIESEAENLWQNCRNINHSDEDSPISGHFNIADGYLISSFYNCINSGLSQALMGVLRNINVGQFKLEHPNEEIILSQKIKVEMTKKLSELYQSERIEEIERSITHTEDEYEKNLQEVLNDFSWVQNLGDDEKTLDDCKKHVFSLLGDDWLFHQKKDLFSHYAQDKICSKVSGSLEFRNWLESSKDDFTEKFLTDIDQKILLKGHALATECIKEYPVDSVVYKLLYKNSREKCFLNGWTSFENEILTEAVSQPLAQKLHISSELIKGRFELRRNEYQVRVMRERFK